MSLARSSLLTIPLLTLFAGCKPASDSASSSTSSANIAAISASPAITLTVDATEAPRRILHSRETIPVGAGALTLLYPKWIPGEHGPTGPVIDVAGIVVTAGGKHLAWRRDLVEMYAISVDVPTGTSSIDVAFDFLLPTETAGFSSGASASSELLVLSWNQVLMYPSAPRPDDLQFKPSLILPTGWVHNTALVASSVAGDTVHFEPLSLTMLVDSPVQSGVHARSFDLTVAGGAKTTLNLVADADSDLAITPVDEAGYKALVVEANALFGAHHYARFEFLYTLSEQVSHFGLEHHQSNDDRVPSRTLIDNNLRLTSADLLPHEFVHSWNGKYRRPAGLATGDFSTPMKGDLLWVYEGLTQYLGKVLAARAGLRSAENYREDQAMLAARLENRPGRSWRPLQDVNDEAQLLYYTRADWDSWRRSVDYYDEGDLIWLEADVTIRKLTNNAKSLDDFCKAFHGGESGAAMVKPYTFDDVVNTLNQVAANDWKAFFNARIRDITPHAPLGGIEGSGWKLSYDETPTAMQKAYEISKEVIDERYSFGVLVSMTGGIIDVIPGFAADKAGLAPGMKITTIGGAKFSAAAVHNALKHAKNATTPITIDASNGLTHKSYAIDYHGGERYPYLERDASKPDVLTSIISPSTQAAAR
ncbi:MAG: M61 family peptidase [Gemmatimonadaceae bacterium]